MIEILAIILIKAFYHFVKEIGDDMVYIVIGYLLCMNVIGFVIMGMDKKKAKRHAYRIPEKTLFAVAIFGGSVGGILGMYHFRHKTKHASFVIGFPFVAIVQILLILWVIFSKISLT